MRLQGTMSKGEVGALANTIEKIKQLREETAAGMMDVKRALEESDGDIEGARRVLRERGQAIAAKKSVGDLLQDTIQRVGENVVVRRFVRYEL
jgi:elongation factor Ts